MRYSYLFVGSLSMSVLCDLFLQISQGVSQFLFLFVQLVDKFCQLCVLTNDSLLCSSFYWRQRYGLSVLTKKKITSVWLLCLEALRLEFRSFKYFYSYVCPLVRPSACLFVHPSVRSFIRFLLGSLVHSFN